MVWKTASTFVIQPRRKKVGHHFPITCEVVFSAQSTVRGYVLVYYKYRKFGKDCVSLIFARFYAFSLGRKIKIRND